MVGETDQASHTEIRTLPARTLLAEFLPLGKPQTVETTRQRTLRVGTRLEQEAVSASGSKPAAAAKSIALSIDGGHVRAARQYQGRTFEVLLAQVSNDAGKQVVFASVPAEATSQTRQLRGVLHPKSGSWIDHRAN
jgi:ATP phosphoribosyltransferase regulatory subunit HisZ